MLLVSAKKPFSPFWGLILATPQMPPCLRMQLPGFVTSHNLADDAFKYHLQVDTPVF